MSRLPTGGFAPLVPEFSVLHLPTSLSFWTGPLGFSIAYDRPEHCFAYLERAPGIQVMLNEVNGNWETGPLARPLGRGVNFQITVHDIAPILAALGAIDWPLFRPPHDAWYRMGAEETGNRQFLVQDPDGYLLRFNRDLGMRKAVSAPPGSA